MTCLHTSEINLSAFLRYTKRIFTKRKKSSIKKIGFVTVDIGERVFPLSLLFCLYGNFLCTNQHHSRAVRDSPHAGCAFQSVVLLFVCVIISIIIGASTKVSRAKIVYSNKYTRKMSELNNGRAKFFRQN